MASPLGQMSYEQFLQQYWQTKPLLIRNAIPNFDPCIDPDDLAGLALEPQIESRIIKEEGKNGPWELTHGPFTNEDFEALPNSKWTLLVQGVDLWVPELADMMELFKFIPNWRRDDVMASFASDGGSVGPHYDQYDVFLIQARGQREWSLGPKCSSEDKRIANTDLHILQEMHITEKWVLNPGDILYVPPQYAHHGIAKGDCMTFSVGFRAPSHSEILLGFTDHIAAELTEDLRYQDPDLNSAAASSGQIDTRSIERVKSVLRCALEDDSKIGDWIGQFMTENKDSELHEELEEPLKWGEIQEALQVSNALVRNETSRLAYLPNDNGITLFANGLSLGFYTRSGSDLIEAICNNRQIELNAIHPLLDKEGQTALLDLINGNHIYFA